MTKFPKVFQRPDCSRHWRKKERKVMTKDTFLFPDYIWLKMRNDMISNPLWLSQSMMSRLRVRSHSSGNNSGKSGNQHHLCPRCPHHLNIRNCLFQSYNRDCDTLASLCIKLDPLIGNANLSWGAVICIFSGSNFLRAQIQRGMYKHKGIQRGVFLINSGGNRWGEEQG